MAASTSPRNRLPGLACRPARFGVAWGTSHLLDLRDLRRQRGWTLEAVAYLAGVDQGTVSRVERGLVEPTPETTVALARTFGISIARLRRLLAEIQVKEVAS